MPQQSLYNFSMKLSRYCTTFYIMTTGWSYPCRFKRSCSLCKCLDTWAQFLYTPIKEIVLGQFTIKNASSQLQIFRNRQFGKNRTNFEDGRGILVSPLGHGLFLLFTSFAFSAHLIIIYRMPASRGSILFCRFATFGEAFYLYNLQKFREKY